MLLRFLGAAGNVTGSRFLVDSGRSRLLVDCGLYQEREYAGRNWDPFPVDPSGIDAVVLSHAHLDHSGYLPRLVGDGFRGPIYCTPATADLTAVILRDSAQIMAEDAAAKRRRHQREERRGPHPEVPLYTAAEAEQAIGRLTPRAYERPFQVARAVEAEFRDAGHILGSATVRLRERRRGQERSVLFSGDLGRGQHAFLRDPAPCGRADHVVVESTYGDRLHEDAGTQATRLAAVVNETVAAGGNIVIPAFAIGRAQEVLHHLGRLMAAGRIPPLLIFLDSPMAISAGQITAAHPGILNAAMREALRQGDSPLAAPTVRLTRTVEASRAINAIRGSVIIIAGAGMCNGGRVKHHLITNIGRGESTILFVGYQAQGTLGRQIIEGRNPVRILGQPREVRARIAQIPAFSAHADRAGLLRWLRTLPDPPRTVYVVHGEAEASQAFAGWLREETDWAVSTPGYGEVVDLSDGRGP